MRRNPQSVAIGQTWSDDNIIVFCLFSLSLTGWCNMLFFFFFQKVYKFPWHNLFVILQWILMILGCLFVSLYFHRLVQCFRWKVPVLTDSCAMLKWNNRFERSKQQVVKLVPNYQIHLFCGCSYLTFRRITCFSTTSHLMLLYCWIGILFCLMLS